MGSRRVQRPQQVFVWPIRRQIYLFWGRDSDNSTMHKKICTSRAPWYPKLWGVINNSPVQLLWPSPFEWDPMETKCRVGKGGREINQRLNYCVHYSSRLRIQTYSYVVIHQRLNCRLYGVKWNTSCPLPGLRGVSVEIGRTLPSRVEFADLKIWGG